MLIGAGPQPVCAGPGEIHYLQEISARGFNNWARMLSRGSSSALCSIFTLSLRRNSRWMTDPQQVARIAHPPPSKSPAYPYAVPERMHGHRHAIAPAPSLPGRSGSGSPSHYPAPASARIPFAKVHHLRIRQRLFPPLAQRHGIDLRRQLHQQPLGPRGSPAQSAPSGQAPPANHHSRPNPAPALHAVRLCSKTAAILNVLPPAAALPTCAFRRIKNSSPPPRSHHPEPLQAHRRPLRRS